MKTDEKAAEPKEAAKTEKIESLRIHTSPPYGSKVTLVTAQSLHFDKDSKSATSSARQKPLVPTSINANNSNVLIGPVTGNVNQTINHVLEAKRYGFDGALTITSQGRTLTSSDEKRQSFNKLTDLEKSKNYVELSVLCKKEISETPEWLTPHFYLGVAQANLGLKDDAIASFKHVVSEMSKDPALSMDPNYRQARTFLKMLQDK